MLGVNCNEQSHFQSPFHRSSLLCPPNKAANTYFQSPFHRSKQQLFFHNLAYQPILIFNLLFIGAKGNTIPIKGYSTVFSISFSSEQKSILSNKRENKKFFNLLFIGALFSRIFNPKNDISFQSPFHRSM